MIKDAHINNPKPLLKGDRIRAGPARSRRASRIADILETVVAGKVREIAIARNVGDSVLYHSLIGLASDQQMFGGMCFRCRILVQVKRTDS
jgi:hypothetical protein